jgi:hypothetical protein
MKIKVYGFKFNKPKLPKAMKVTEVFSFMEAHAGAKLGKLYRFGTHKVPVEIDGKKSEWWGGMVLKVRDSKAFTKLTEKNGKTILTAETLAENEKLVELTFFVVHPETGSGLLAHHYQGTSLTAFAGVCQRVFARAQKAAFASVTKGMTANDKKVVAPQFKGLLSLEQLCNDTDLKSLVKQLKRVSSFELRLATLETTETFLRGIVEKASNEVIKLTFPPETDVDELADDAVELANEEKVAEIKVTGYDEKNTRREYFKDQNPLIFYEFDYDDLMKGLVLDLDDWSISINGSAMIKQLIAVASGKTTLNLLENA